MSEVDQQSQARALIARLFVDASLLTGRSCEPAVARHRADRRAWFGDAVDALMCATSRVPALLDALGGSAADPVRIALVADSGVLGVEQAKNLLLDQDRCELVGIRLALPEGGDPAMFAARVLDALTFTVPTTIEVPPVPGWAGALDVLASDGAERVGFTVDGARPQQLAEQLVAAAARRLTVVLGPDVRPAVTDGTQHGALNLLAATAAATDGASATRVTDLLAQVDTRALQVVVGAIPAARTRGLLGTIECADVAGMVTGLVDAGWIAPD